MSSATSERLRTGRGLPLWAFLVAVLLVGLAVGLVARHVDRQRRAGATEAKLREVEVDTVLYLERYAVTVVDSLRIFIPKPVPAATGPRRRSRFADVLAVGPEPGEASAHGWPLHADGVEVDAEVDGSGAVRLTIQHSRSPYADRLARDLAAQCGGRGWQHEIVTRSGASIPALMGDQDQRPTFLLACLRSAAAELGPITGRDIDAADGRWSITQRYQAGDPDGTARPSWITATGGRAGSVASPIEFRSGGGPEVARVVAAIRTACEDREWLVAGPAADPAGP